MTQSEYTERVAIQFYRYMVHVNTDPDLTYPACFENFKASSWFTGIPTVTEVTQQEREKQVAIAYASHIKKFEYTNTTFGEGWIDFYGSKLYESIPPATDQLREKIEGKLKEIKAEMIFHPLGASKRIIEILENLLTDTK
jgi:hypothetical protein